MFAKYEIGEFIGCGQHGAYFHIRDHDLLGVKVLPFNTGITARNELLDQLQKTRALRKLGISVPRAIDVVPILIPKYLEESMKRWTIANNSTGYLHKIKAALLLQKGQTVWGLVMEEIDHDDSLVSHKRVSYLYESERDKIQALGIQIVDSSPEYNILWSASKARLYFMDFEHWKFPPGLLKS